MQKSRKPFLFREKFARSALALACGLGGLAHADIIVGTGTPTNSTLGETTAKWLTPTPSGTGHMLVMPYYSTQNGNETALSISNADPLNGKVVKIRFRAAGSGDPLLNFTLLMRPTDIWRAKLRKDDSGITEIVALGNDCTFPQSFTGSIQDFSPFNLNPRLSPEKKALQMAEGYVEIVQAADIPSLPVYGPGGNEHSALSVAVRNFDCFGPSFIIPLLSSHTQEAEAAGWGFAGPTGGLSGKWSIGNAQAGTSFSGSMQAIQAIDDAGNSARGNFVLFPQASGTMHMDSETVTADPLLRAVAFGQKSALGVTALPVAGPAMKPYDDHFPDMTTPYTLTNARQGAKGPLRQAAQLSASFAVRSVRNEYNTEPTITAATDWVFSMPMMRFSVGADYGSDRALYSLVPPEGGQFFHDGNLIRSAYDRAQSCLKTEPISYRDGSGIGRAGASPMTYCALTSVLSFGSPATSLLGALVARVNTGADSFVDGWGQASFADPVTTLGTPVTAASFSASRSPTQAPPPQFPSKSFNVNSEHSHTR